GSFLPFFAGGGTEEQARALVLGSDEYLARSGGTAEGFLAALFRDVLGRDLGVGEGQRFLDLLRAGASRAAVARRVLPSPEPDAREVAAVYAALLGRAPDEVGLAGWASVLAGGVSDEQVAVGIASSTEFAARPLG